MIYPLTNIPNFIMEFWNKKISDKEELDIFYINNDIYISFLLKAECRSLGQVIVNNLLGKIVDGNLFIHYQLIYPYDMVPSIEWIAVELFEKLIKLKAFL